MTRFSTISSFHSIGAVALLATAALLLPATSFRDTRAADPPGGASTSGPDGKTLQRDSELSNVRRMMLEELTYRELQLRKAQAALEAAKDARSKDMHQAEVDAIVASRNRLYAQVVVNRLSLDALYAPPTMGSSSILV